MIRTARVIILLLFALLASSSYAQTDVSGTWTGQYTGNRTQMGCGSTVFTTTGSMTAVALQTGSAVTGTVYTTNGFNFNGTCTPTRDKSESSQFSGSVSGSTVALTGLEGGTVTATVNGNAMSGTYTDGDGAGFGSFTLTKAAPAASSGCNPQLSVTCSTGSCAATTLNAGGAPCSGQAVTGFLSYAPLDQLTFSNFQSFLGATAQCVDSTTLPITGIGAFVFCFGPATLAPGASGASSVSIAVGQMLPPSTSVIAITQFEDPNDPNGGPLGYASATLNPPTCTSVISVPTISPSGVPYTVTWTATGDPNTSYELDESTTADFSNAPMQSVSAASKQFTHTVSATTTYYYRVRANSCGGSPGPFSTTASIVVQVLPPATNKPTDTVVVFGTLTPVQVARIFIAGGAGGKTALDTTFTVATDKGFLSANPSSGTIPPNGTTVAITANPASLPPGANTGTVTVTSGTGAPIQSTPVSISLVTPVANQGKSSPPSNALIIPVVTHVNGATAPFQSDVRLTNAGNTPISYQITFTPTRSDGTQTGKVTVVPVDSGQTVALNDIVNDFFGFGATGATSDVGFGSLDIRPVNSPSLLNYASSRTYATTSKGTLGQFVPAIPFTAFATKASANPLTPPATLAPVLSLQQVAQSAKFRTNLGIVEGSGAPASGNIKVYDDTGALLKTVPYSLLAGEHQQLNSFISQNAGIGTLDDGRIEITVDSATGAVMAYASVLDNITTDPLAVSPVQVAKVSATRYVLPGVAALPGTANFHSDIRIYNGGKTAASATLTYFAGTTGTPSATVTAQPITIGPGQVNKVDDLLPTLFNVSSGGGSLLVTTPAASSLVVTGRTYSIGSDTGTYGQFVPGISPNEGIGMGDRALQILQLEQSNNFRSNLGIFELTGNPATVHLTVSFPDSKVSVSPPADIQLAGNGFIQLPAFLNSITGTGTNTYNARVTVQVTGGTGRVSAYASVIDNQTQDPTYVPAQ